MGCVAAIPAVVDQWQTVGLLLTYTQEEGHVHGPERGLLGGGGGGGGGVGGGVRQEKGKEEAALLKLDL